MLINEVLLHFRNERFRGYCIDTGMKIAGLSLHPRGNPFRSAMQSSTSQWGRSSRWPAVAVVLVVICLVFSGCSRDSREARYLASGKQMLAKKDYASAIIQFSNAAKM